ncbi:MAG: UDP-3-O-(3-hydroxymyristoyl)glucosamine N-acyltransferase [Alphaproteobacteria bacterium]|nr:UDP-3-O-(3-hydroxymyristoyl)glucosamine N-acyltransferase [Alphaproteobacteria bacterium]
MVDTTFFKNKGPFTLKQIAEITGAELTQNCNENDTITDIATMENAGDNEICFFYDRKAKEKATNIKAKVCITTPDLQTWIPYNVSLMIVADPKLAFLKLNQAMYEEFVHQAEIAPSAIISKTATIGQNCYIGPNVVIEDNVVIGDNCYLEAGCYIGSGCKLGHNNRIGVGAYITYTIMGNGCYIYAGAKLGADGFGFNTISGKHVRIPQLGRVIIGNDVEIGANTCVDRGALDDTIIGDGCRVDNLVQIAHNDKIGRGCIIVAQTGIAGSCTFGDYVVCGGQTGFADHLTVGSGAQVGAQSGIMRDIEPGTVVMGTPAVPFKDFMRQVSFLQRNSKK